MADTVGSIKWDASLDTSKLKSDSAQAETSLSKLGSVGIAALKTTAVAAAAAAAAAAVSVAAFGVSAIKSYAEYEQLVGGVDTLFKSSSNQVQQYAQTAYKTAGLSANEYMSTITSFSASLLQGLGGDTKKAAEIGNMAVTDMADNANKMGTGIDMIQNAYQGFAKDNYTMLDNLKLGYGGTAGEMARLVNDSGVMGDSMKVTAETVNSIPFDKQIEAIHKIQTKMGITGTTAKEAAGTISGSWSSLTGSWENVKTAIASGNDDLFNGAVDGLIESFGNFSKNIIKVVPNVLSGLVKLIETVVPQVAPLLSQIISTLLPALVSGAIALLNSIVAMIPTIVPILLQALPAVINGAVQLFLGLVQALPVVVRQLTAALPMIINTVVGALTNPSTILTLLQAGVDLLLALVNAIPIIITSLQNAIPTIITNIVRILTSPQYITLMLTSGFQLMVALLNGAMKIIGNIPVYMGRVVDGIVNHFMTTDWAQVGRDIMTGLGNGLIGAKDKVIGTIKDIAKNALNEVKKFFGIHSPSKVMAQMGTYMMQGWSIGMDKSSSMAISSAQRASSGVLGTFDNLTSPTLGINGAGSLGGSVGSRTATITNNYVVNNQADAEIISRKQAYAMGAV